MLLLIVKRNFKRYLLKVMNQEKMGREFKYKMQIYNLVEKKIMSKIKISNSISKWKLKMKYKIRANKGLTKTRK